MRTLSLKIDVCTREGLDRGVPPLLDLLARHDVRATFCLAFGPDNSGKALFNVFRPGFLKKMLRTGAPSTYGWRTVVSGTLLPARPIGSGVPELVRRIAAAGHEVAIHGWDHRRWQDGLPAMDEHGAVRELETALVAATDVVGEAPVGTAAPGWIVTDASLRAQDRLPLRWASDLRGGPPCRLRSGGTVHRIVQLPTAGPCIEELLAQGVRDPAALGAALLAGVADAETAVFAVHAEIEGRAFHAFFDELLPRLREGRDAVVRLRDVAERLAAGRLPVRDLVQIELPGRSGTVASAGRPPTQEEQREEI